MTSQVATNPNEKNIWQDMGMWFLITIIAGLLPLLFRYFIYTISLNFECTNYSIYDIKDAINFGLAINVSNFSLTISKAFSSKPIVLTMSGLMGIVLAFLTALSGLLECAKSGVTGLEPLNNWTWILVCCSVILSGVANYNVYKTAQ